MVNGWFGAFSGLGPSNRGTPKNPNPFHFWESQESKVTGPNHQAKPLAEYCFWLKINQACFVFARLLGVDHFET